jgi:hypothetical protein
LGQHPLRSLPQDVANTSFEEMPGKETVELLRSAMVAYSWGNGIEATTFNPKYAAFFNSTSSIRFGYISREGIFYLSVMAANDLIEFVYCLFLFLLRLAEFIANLR